MRTDLSIISDHDRHALALAMLDEDEHVEEVLGDLLEEAGQDHYARGARQCVSSLRGRLEFTLAILPYRTAALAACEFVDRALSIMGREMPMRRMTLLRRVAELGRRIGSAETPNQHMQIRMNLEDVRRWLRQPAPLEQAPQINGGMTNIPRCVVGFRSVMHLAVQVSRHEATGDAKELDGSVRQLRRWVYRTTRAARNAAVNEQFRRSPSTGRRRIHDVELQWQVDRARLLLHEILESQNVA